MRVVSLGIALVLLVAGLALAWIGFEVGYRAIDLDAYRDSKPAVYLIAGSLFSVVGVALMVGALLTARLAFDRQVGRGVVAVIFGLGCVPYPWLLGPAALVFNLLLLGIAVVLLSRNRETWTARRS